MVLNNQSKVGITLSTLCLEFIMISICFAHSAPAWNTNPHDKPYGYHILIYITILRLSILELLLPASLKYFTYSSYLGHIPCKEYAYIMKKYMCMNNMNWPHDIVRSPIIYIVSNIWYNKKGCITGDHMLTFSHTILGLISSMFVLNLYGLIRHIYFFFSIGPYYIVTVPLVQH